MARGWESKSIESQQQDAGGDGGKAPKAALSPTERSVLQRRRTLELARARTVADLQRSSSPIHRQMLERALSAIEDQIRELGS